jgi:Zn-dependent protease with chaperone function
MEITPEEPMEQLPTKPARRRTIDISTGATLALGAPWFLVSFAVVSLVARFFGTAGIALVVLWLASGAIIFYRPAENVLAFLEHMRRPTAQELQTLDRAWQAVAQAAGIDGAKYELRVEESREINASAMAGHIVAVTRRSLNSLSPRHLEAVLAHELGHHLQGHAWASLLTYWYSLPGRLAYAVAGFVARMLSHIACLGCLIVGGIGLLIIGIAVQAPYLLLVVAIPPTLAYVSRLSEKRADRVAAELGYGPQKIELLYRFIEEGEDLARAKAGLRAHLMSSHPSCADRIRALEHFLATRYR